VHAQQYMPSTWGWPQTPNIYLGGEGAAFKNVARGCAGNNRNPCHHMPVHLYLDKGTGEEPGNHRQVNMLSERPFQHNPFPCVHVHLYLIALDLVM
jgi:hypothetical protein